MLLPRIFVPARASSTLSAFVSKPSSRILDAVRATNGTSTPSPTLSFVRYASHQSQGRANGAKDGPGKRLGAKKSGGEYVIPGNIIFRQRGTAWFPGDNCKMGRDHCIYATESGYVRYYRDPLKHPERQYIGVVFTREEKLPHPPNAARRRRLNMVAVTREPEPNTHEGQVVVVGDLQAESATSVPDNPTGKVARNLTMGRGYAYREANWEIGRLAEKSNVRVNKFVPGDRFTAWKRSKARIDANAEKKRLRSSQKATKPKAKKR